MSNVKAFILSLNFYDDEELKKKYDFLDRRTRKKIIEKMKTSFKKEVEKIVTDVEQHVK